MKKPDSKHARTTTGRTRRTSTRVTAAKTVRRPETSGPRVERLAGDVNLEVPRGCCATVLLKLVARDSNRRYYAWWLTVGRYDLDTIAVPYKYTGEDTIRVDIPEGVSPCSCWLQSSLTGFLAKEGSEEPHTPVVGGPPPTTRPE